MEAKRSIIKSTGEVSHPEDKIKYIFLLLFLFIVAVGMEAFAVDYVVTANTLNVRSAPNVHSKVIGKLAKGDQIVNASSEPGDWICFMLDGKEMGYASTQYLKPINKPQKQNTQLSQDRMRYVMAINEAMNRLRWCVCIGLAAYFIFFVLGDRLGIPVFLVFLAMLVLPALLLYYLSNTSYSLWFIYPSVVGWGWTIANFLLFLYLGFMAAMFCIEGIKQLFDWEYPMFTLFAVGAGCLWGYAIYLCISAISHQVPEAFLVLFGMCPGAYKGATGGSGTLRDKYGHDVDGHFGSNGDFSGRDGNTYKKNWGDDSWSREE